MWRVFLTYGVSVMYVVCVFNIWYECVCVWCVCLLYGVSVMYVVCVFNIWCECVICGVRI